MRETIRDLLTDREPRAPLLTEEEVERIVCGVRRWKEKGMSQSERDHEEARRRVIEPVRDAQGNVLPSETWVCGLCSPPFVIVGRDAFFDHCEETHPEIMVDTLFGKSPDAKSGVVSHSDYADRVMWTTLWWLHDGRHLADSYVISPRIDDGPWHDG